jgi:hypothetical protein
VKAGQGWRPVKQLSVKAWQATASAAAAVTVVGAAAAVATDFLASSLAGMG